MSKQLYTVSKEGLEYLCGLINKIVTLPSDVISDITLSTNKTMSSVKIDKIIKQCLQDANEYSNEVVNSLTHLVAEKIDFEPTLDNTTDKINTLLLYSANSDNNYTQYLRLTNELLNLGDTSLSLNEYIKEVDADTKFALKTTTDTLTTEVTNIKSDFNTHKDDTDIHITADNKDKWDKTNTDFNTHKDDTGIHVTTTDKENWNKVVSKANQSDLMNHITNSTTHITSTERTAWNNKIDKSSISTNIKSSSTDSQVVSAKAVYDKYNKLDKGVTTFTLSAPSGMTISNSSSYYCVTNGICFVSITFTCTTTSSITWKTFAIGLPKSKLQCHLSFASSDSGGSPLYIILTTGGILTIYLGNNITNSTTYHATFSYPVSES